MEMWNSLFGLKSPASFECCQSLSGKGRCHILGPLPDVLSAPSLNILACQACVASCLGTGSNSPLGDDQLTAQSLSSPMCPEHMTTGLMIRLQKVIIDLHTRVSLCHVHLWNPYVQTWCSLWTCCGLHRSPVTGRHLGSNHAAPGLSVVAYMSIKVSL